jgi:septum formation protein
METIALASSSQRRKELLESLGIPFEALEPGTDESLRDGLPPAKRVVALAEDKARAGAAKLPTSGPRLVVGADTLVCRTGEGRSELVMGKPTGRDEARRMIEALEGRDHFVHTGLALLDRGTGVMRTVRSDSLVRFAPMNGLEIDAYLDTGEWEGVAGAYRIQGAAAFHIMRIDGSWSGIVGLPLRELYVILREAGYRVSENRQA